MKYKEFIFENYHYDQSCSTLSLRYRFGEGPQFQEELVFDFPQRPCRRQQARFSTASFA